MDRIKKFISKKAARYRKIYTIAPARFNSPRDLPSKDQLPFMSDILSILSGFRLSSFSNPDQVHPLARAARPYFIIILTIGLVTVGSWFIFTKNKPLLSLLADNFVDDASEEAHLIYTGAYTSTLFHMLAAYVCISRQGLTEQKYFRVLQFVFDRDAEKDLLLQTLPISTLIRVWKAGLYLFWLLNYNVISGTAMISVLSA